MAAEFEASYDNHHGPTAKMARLEQRRNGSSNGSSSERIMSLKDFKRLENMESIEMDGSSMLAVFKVCPTGSLSNRLRCGHALAQLSEIAAKLKINK